MCSSCYLIKLTPTCITCLKYKMVGGPWVIWNRYAEVSETYLRPDKKYICGSICRYNCNGLYLGSFCTPMPTFMYVRHYVRDDFVPQYSLQGYKMYIWLQCMVQKHNVHMLTWMSGGDNLRAGEIHAGQIGSSRWRKYYSLRIPWLLRPLPWKLCTTRGALAKQGVHSEAYGKWLKKKRIFKTAMI